MFSCSGSGSKGKPSPAWDGQKRNVVLISIDSLRRDHLGLYGHKPRYSGGIPVSPNLDELGANGVVFEDAWTTTSWTLPSHMALMTGLSDRQHGVETDKFQLDPLRATLAQRFQESGWSTAGYFSGPYLDPRYGFGRGFDDYRSGMLSQEAFVQRIATENDKRAAAGLEPMEPRLIQQLRDRMSHWDITSPRINQLGQEFLDQQQADGDKPFFLFLHYFDAHYDHIPDEAEEGLDKKFDPGYTGPFDGRNWYFDERVMQFEKPYQRLISGRDLEHVKALYDAEIHWVDRHIGEIITKLKAKGLYENTVIMVVSDHGDEFFDHGSIGHRSTLLAEQCRIPMVLSVPGITPKGKRIPQLSRIYDVAPTLLDYAGANGIDEAEGSSVREMVEGYSSPRTAFQRLFSGGHRRGSGLNVRDGWRSSRFSVLRQHRGDFDRETETELFTTPMQIRSLGSTYFVFDRKEDPKELRPLSPKDPRFQQAIDAFCKDFRAAEQASAKLPRSEHSVLTGMKFSAEEQAALDALGYTSMGEESGGKVDIMAKVLAPLAEPCD
ncbi:MAG: sulfatase [Planctomycetota bacterium]|nr:sulfatase [Planctomycetota bacterium]